MLPADAPRSADSRLGSPGAAATRLEPSSCPRGSAQRRMARPAAAPGHSAGPLWAAAEPSAGSQGGAPGGGPFPNSGRRVSAAGCNDLASRPLDFFPLRREKARPGLTSCSGRPSEPARTTLLAVSPPAQWAERRAGHPGPICSTYLCTVVLRCVRRTGVATARQLHHGGSPASDPYPVGQARGPAGLRRLHSHAAQPPPPAHGSGD